MYFDLEYSAITLRRIPFATNKIAIIDKLNLIILLITPPINIALINIKRVERDSVAKYNMK